MSDFSYFHKKSLEGDLFSQNEMTNCISILMDGGVTRNDAAEFLTALFHRGETVDEITGAAMALRARASTINAPDGAIDCCGTGGDGAHTFNISTAVALVSAACGVKIAKHGNRAASSKCGAADVLEHLGVTLNLSKETLERALNDIGFCFLMAPHHHAAMKHVAGVRKALGHRTIFNLLGPLANPANTKIQLMGVYDKKWILPITHALKNLGSARAMVVHGQDGLDEISLNAPTDIALLKDNLITQKTITPDDFGLSPINPDDIKGGDAATNANALLALLKATKNAYRDIVLANTAAVIYLHDDTSFKDGVARAAAAIDNGDALKILESYKALTS